MSTQVPVSQQGTAPRTSVSQQKAAPETQMTPFNQVRYVFTRCNKCKHERERRSRLYLECFKGQNSEYWKCNA